jgi:hypothetical protein
LKLPADHPLKKELAEVRATRAERTPKWLKLQQHFPERFKGDLSNSRLAYKREMQLAADKEAKLLWFINQLELGKPVGAIGLRQEQLESVVTHNQRAPAATPLYATAAGQQTARRSGRFSQSRPSLHSSCQRDVMSRPEETRIPKQQQMRDKKAFRNVESAISEPLFSHEQQQLDEFSQNDDFIDIDNLFEDNESEPIEVIDLTGDNDYNDDDQRILDEMEMELAPSNVAARNNNNVARQELGPCNNQWIISPSISSDEDEMQM